MILIAFNFNNSNCHIILKAYILSIISQISFSEFNLGSSKIESFTPRSPSSKDGQSVKYGPYKNIAAKSNARITVHFENNSPFLIINELTRIVEVSYSVTRCYQVLLGVTRCY